MRWPFALLLLVTLAGPAAAGGCSRSLDYILNDLPDELPQPASAYQALFQACRQTLTLNNVQDAFILRDGGIAVIPREFSILATAETLAAFCRKFPRDTLRFITRREKRRGLTTGLVVMMSSVYAQSCPAILGGG